MGQKSQKKIVHFRRGCIGCGMCAYICPKYWKMSDKDGLSDLIGSKVVKKTEQRNIEFGDEDLNKQASDACPVNVIKIT